MSGDVGDVHFTLDPVCGMKVDPGTAPFRSEWQGQTVSFCCEGCKKAFDRKPALYAVAQE